ncbi:CLUMA_CG006219, isoform A [Clunio marinus]|uniref:CLUMA_CG006219, isoform A n=1 Tax=Clunio marinus TaxID=568069 RepID=A0A1J1I2Q9_9DIPT|nr:CLUMA_CG006219, isoform A [Clunio marinus]
MTPPPKTPLRALSATPPAPEDDEILQIAAMEVEQEEELQNRRPIEQMDGVNGSMGQWVPITSGHIKKLKEAEYHKMGSVAQALKKNLVKIEGIARQKLINCKLKQENMSTTSLNQNVIKSVIDFYSNDEEMILALNY